MRSIPTPTDQGFPLITYKSDKGPYDWGLQHGEEFKAGIRELVAIRTELMLAKSPHLREHLEKYAHQQMAVTRQFAPQAAHEMEGIAQGAGITPTEVVVLNNYTDFRDIKLPDEGCSTVHVQSAKGVFSGQTWDMHGSARQYLCVLHIPQSAQTPEALVLSLVGCVGLMGITAKGTFIGVNNINTGNAKSALIWPALVRQCLLAKDLSGMREYLKSAPVTSGHNYLVSDASGGEHWEITPSSQECVGKLAKGQKGVVFHTNHCLGPEARSIEDTKSLSSTTHCRFDLLAKKAHKVHTMEDLYGLLTDHEEHPKSICSHYVAQALDPSFTCGGGVTDMNSGETVLWRGCPTFDKNLYKEFRFKRQNGHFKKV